jgi:hypothetical protein
MSSGTILSCAASVSSVAWHATDGPAGRRAVRSSYAAGTRARPRSAAVRGLEVSLRDILQGLLQRQLRHQPLQLVVLRLQFLETLGLIQLKPTELLPNRRPKRNKRNNPVFTPLP